MHFCTFLGQSTCWVQRSTRKLSELAKTLVNQLLPRSIKDDSACSVNYLVEHRVINDRACCRRGYCLSPQTLQESTVVLDRLQDLSWQARLRWNLNHPLVVGLPACYLRYPGILCLRKPVVVVPMTRRRLRPAGIHR